MAEIKKLQRAHRSYALAYQSPWQVEEHCVSVITDNWYPSIELLAQYEAHVINDPSNADVEWHVVERTTLVLEAPELRTLAGGNG